MVAAVAACSHQVKAIAEIVVAVREADHWRAGVLMERFVVHANLSALLALRAALSEVQA